MGEQEEEEGWHGGRREGYDPPTPTTPRQFLRASSSHDLAASADISRQTPAHTMPLNLPYIAYLP